MPRLKPMMIMDMKGPVSCEKVDAWWRLLQSL